VAVTREYFADVRAHLAPHGVACSWFFTYADAASRSIIRAWLDVFPHAYLFENAGTQSVLIGLRDDSDLSAANIAHALARPDVARAAATVGFNGPADVFRGFVAGPETLRRQTAGVVANTDDNAFVAFHALPGGAPPQYQRVVPQPDDPTPFVRVTLGSPEETAEFSTRLRAIAERQAVPAPQS
jgi:hypothetical protein